MRTGVGHGLCFTPFHRRRRGRRQRGPQVASLNQVQVSGERRDLITQESELKVRTTQKAIEETRREAGCRAYSYAEDVLEPGLIHVSEAWDSAEALTTHFASAHMRRWQEERTALGLTERDITRYEVTGAEAL